MRQARGGKRKKNGHLEILPVKGNARAKQKKKVELLGSERKKRVTSMIRKKKIHLT